MIASNSGPRWRTSTSTSPALQPARHPQLHMRGDPARQPHARAFLALGVERRVPAFDLAPFGGRDQRPDFDQPGRGVRAAIRARECRLSSVVTLTKTSRAREHLIDRAEHVLARAERMVEPQIAPAQLGRVELRARTARRISSNAFGAAPWNEKIDCFSSPTANIVRFTFGRAPPGDEFGDDGLDDLPLLRAGVLRLVDQHMVDAEIELVEHPGGRQRWKTAPASCRSGRHSRAARGVPFRAR